MDEFELGRRPNARRHQQRAGLPVLPGPTCRYGHLQKYIDQLLAEGKAYKCYCTEEELEENRQKCLAEHRPPKYSGKCSHLTEAQQKELEAQGRKYVIRFRMPQEGDVEWDDMIRGHVKFASKDLYDLVIQKRVVTPLTILP